MQFSRRLFAPAECQAILDRMTGNRVCKPNVVKKYASDMAEGRWVDTHEPIAMSVDGNLIDGQHRLAAVIESGCSQYFWLAVYDTQQTARGLPIDCGAMRTTADITGIDKPVVQVINRLFRMTISGQNRDPRPDEVRTMLPGCAAEVSAVIYASRSGKRLKGSAVCRAAVVANVLLHETFTEEIIAEFARWNAADNLTWQSVIALNKQFDTGKAMRPAEQFLKTAKAFDPRNKDKSYLRVNDSEAAIVSQELRTGLRAIFANLGSV